MASGSGGTNNLTAANHPITSTGATTIRNSGTNATGAMLVNPIGAGTGIEMASEGATGILLKGTVSGNSASVVLSGTQASLQGASETVLGINGWQSDAVPLGGGIGTMTGSTASLSGNRASIMIASGNGI